MATFIIRNWKGEEKLWKVFWIWYVLVAPVVTAATQVISFLTLFPIAIHVEYAGNLPGITFKEAILALLGISIIIFSVIYLTWVFMSLWRSAFNCSNKVLGYLARLCVVTPLFFGVLSLLGLIFPNSIFIIFI